MKRQQFIKFGTALALAVGFAFSATHPAFAVQTFSVVTCALATPTPCVGGTNTSTGPGVQGISNLGFGNVGQTKFNSTSTANAKAGILGQDLSTSGTNDEGVRGTSVRGLGVHGISTSRSGVRGDATSAQGTFGSSSSNAGAQGVSVTGPGVVGQSTSTTGSGNGGTFTASGHGNGISASANQNGIAGLFNSTSGTGIFSFANSSGFGIDASSASSVGVFGIGTTGGEFEDRTATTTGQVLFLNGFGSKMIRANNSSGIDVFTLNNSGQITATGPINSAGSVTSNTSGSFGSSTTFTGNFGFGNGVGVQGSLSGTLSFPKSGVQGNNTGDASSIAVRANGFGGRLFVGNNSAGSDVFIVDNAGIVHARGFAADLSAASTRGTAAISAPPMEDYGEARLSGGVAYVPLKTSFGAAIDHNQTYLVFITPQGAVRGNVYVSQKDARGFTVREMGGTSSVAFDYRIVAKASLAPVSSSAELHAVTGAPKTQLMPPAAIHMKTSTKRSNALPIPAALRHQ